MSSRLSNMVMLFVVVVPIGTAMAQSSPSPPAAMKMAIAQLTEEATDAIEEGVWPRKHADFAESFEHALPLEALGQKLCRRLHRNQQIDAYIRWQLTSFKPQLPEIDDRSFAALLKALPSLQTNPLADEKFLGIVNRALAVESLSESDAARLQTMYLDALQRAERVKKINVAAVEFRRWVESQFESSCGVMLHLTLDNCQAMCNAGWPTGKAGARAEKLFASCKEVTKEQRRSLVQKSQLLLKEGRPFVQSLVITDGVPSVSFGDASFYDFDIRRWFRSLDKDA